jgi:hypothetical protein
VAKKRTSTRSKKNTPKPLVITDSTPNDVLFPPGFGHGYDPLQKAAHPSEFAAPPSEMKLIPRSEWDARIAEQDATESSLEHIRLRGGPNGGMIPSLDQNGQGFCWMYSVTMSVMMERAAAGQPCVRLSAHAGACKVKSFRDEGGWCGLGAKWVRENGQPPVSLWAEKSMSREYDTAETWKEAAKYKITEDWVDLGKQVYDQNLTADQIATCLLLNIPVAIDYDEWGHSICAIRWVKIEGGSYGPKILNSWTDQWGDRGMSVIQRGWTVDGAVATRVAPGS